MAELKFTATRGTKLEYSSDNTSFTQLKGVVSIPEIGSTPATIDTTTLDNLEMKTSILGLQEAQTLDIPFNMEDPDVESNFKKAYDISHDPDVSQYDFRITYANGITIEFKGEPSTRVGETAIDGLYTFTLSIVMASEPKITIP